MIVIDGGQFTCDYILLFQIVYLLIGTGFFAVFHYLKFFL